MPMIFLKNQQQQSHSNDGYVYFNMINTLNSNYFLPTLVS